MTVKLKYREITPKVQQNHVKRARRNRTRYVINSERGNKVETMEKLDCILSGQRLLEVEIPGILKNWGSDNETF